MDGSELRHVDHHAAARLGSPIDRMTLPLRRDLAAQLPSSVDRGGYIPIRARRQYGRRASVDKMAEIVRSRRA
jgi:hypothetical protein